MFLHYLLFTMAGYLQSMGDTTMVFSWPTKPSETVVLQDFQSVAHKPK